jgi:hypothetical protein
LCRELHDDSSAVAASAILTSADSSVRDQNTYTPIRLFNRIAART